MRTCTVTLNRVYDAVSAGKHILLHTTPLPQVAESEKEGGNARLALSPPLTITLGGRSGADDPNVKPLTMEFEVRSRVRAGAGAVGGGNVLGLAARGSAASHPISVCLPLGGGAWGRRKMGHTHQGHAAMWRRA